MAVMLWMCAGPGSGQTPSGSPEDGPSLLQETFKALGGEAYLSVKTVTSAGRIYEFRDGNTTGAVMFKDSVEYPDKVRTEFGQKHPLVMINNRLQGWVVDNGVIQSQSAQEVVQFLKSQQHDLDYLLRWRLQREKFEVVAAGKAKVDDVDALQMDLIFPGVETIHLFVDAGTKLPMKLAFRSHPSTRTAAGNPSAQGAAAKDTSIAEEVSYSNFHVVGGVHTPFHSLITRDGQKAAEIFLEEVKFNDNFPASLFANPATPGSKK